MDKKFKIIEEDIKEILPTKKSCYATDMITVKGEKVGYMYREHPDEKYDSGWRFFSGNESQEYVDDPNNLAMYKLNTIANYDPSVIPYLEMPIGTALERKVDTNIFEVVDDE